MTPRRCSLCRQEGHDRRKCPYTPDEALSLKNAHEPRKKARGSGSRIMNRESTTLAAAMNDSIAHKEKNCDYPEYTKEDEINKQEIWGYKPGRSAIDNTKRAEAMDHMVGLREGLKKYDIAGSVSKFNQIPCTNDENSGPEQWKKIPGSDKNLVYDFHNFTEDEIDNFDEKTKEKYYKLKNWVNYCKQRGADLYYYGETENDDKRQEVIHTLHEFLQGFTHAQQEGDHEFLEKAKCVMAACNECLKLKK